MNDGNAKQQIVEHIKNATNILVSVSTNPSVDGLSAALALTLMLNKMDKHATAVFSGAVPPAISFLEPQKTFEGTVDSLRDFIIALDKEKADRLRYKVENDVVRIFITPYRTTITQRDLEFSQGDFNVDLVIALGVDKRDTLDAAIVAHGRILHDAAVITINANDQQSSLGSVDWHDASASSLCEMLMSLSEALQSGLLDEPMATALLTGIVAATERFANRRTTPKVMTMSAQLMAAGANQQLIATKLEEGNELPTPAPQLPPPAANRDGSTSLKENASSKVRTDEQPASAPAPVPVLPPPEEKKPNDGEILVSHDHQPAPSVNLPPPAVPETAVEAAEDALEEALATHGRPPQPPLGNLQQALEQEAESQSAPPPPEVLAPVGEPARPDAAEKPSWMAKRLEPPTMGGTLNATSEEALEDKLRQQEQERRQMLLSHDGSGQVTSPLPAQPPAFNSFGLQYEEAPLPEAAPPALSEEPEPVPEPPTDTATQAPLSQPYLPVPEPPQPPPAADSGQTPHTKTLTELEAEAHARAAQRQGHTADAASNDLDQARQAVSDALNGTPYAAELQQPLPQPAALTSPPQLPPLPDFSTLPPLPQQPDGSLPLPQPDDYQPEPPAQPPILPNTPQANPADPGQFRIPGQ